MGKSTNLSAQQKAEEVRWRLYQNPALSVHPVTPEEVYVLGGVAELPNWQKCAVAARRKLQQMTEHKHFPFLDQKAKSAA